MRTTAQQRETAFWLTVITFVIVMLALSCKTVQSVRCISTSFKPVVVIGVNGIPNTILVPFCDTLQVIPKIPDTLQLK